MASRFTRTTRLRTARFPIPGSFAVGLVSSITDVPVPEFDSNNKITGPKFDVSGLVVTQPDILLVGENGEETVLHANPGVSVAIAQQLEAIGAADLEEGDILTVTYVGDEDADEGIPTKVYEAEIVKPKASAKAAKK
jgi:hypothetical protein